MWALFLLALIIYLVVTYWYVIAGVIGAIVLFWLAGVWLSLRAQAREAAEKFARWERNPKRIPRDPDLRESWRLEYRQ